MRIRVSRKPHVPVTLEEEDLSGKLVEFNFSVREMMGPTRKAYMQEMSEAIKIDPKRGTVKRAERDDAMVTLLAYTLYDDKDKLVDRDLIAGWSNSSLIALFEIAQKQNGMTTEAEEEEKKDSPGKKNSGSELPPG